MTQAGASHERIEQLVRSKPVFLFMKGNPAAPQCGFSAQVIQILDRLVSDYGSFDVLSDPELRDAIKEYSDWPTIPQLYVDGEFMGGCDIVKEMYETGELLRRAQRESGGSDLHLSIDARFQSALGFGPEQPGDLTIELGGLSFHLDPDSAARADGVTIDVADSPEGARLTIDNPNAPEPAAGARSQAPAEG